MKSIITLITIVIFSFNIMAQGFTITTEKLIKPEIGKSHDISEKGKKSYQEVITKIKRIENDLAKLGESEISKEDSEFLATHEMDVSPLSTDVAGCSWYCASLIDNIRASNVLEESDNYKAWNAHDFDLSRAWATNENKGIGESLTFVFGKSEVLTVNQIQIYNGYQKSEKTWKNNSRVKKISLSINGKHYANLELEDVRNVQIFDIASQNFLKNENLSFEFKILEIYPGDKYEDLCISEINFDGEGDH